MDGMIADIPSIAIFWGPTNEDMPSRVEGQLTCYTDNLIMSRYILSKISGVAMILNDIK